MVWHGTTLHALSHAHASSPALPERLHSSYGSRARSQHGWDPQHAHLRASCGAPNSLNSALDRDGRRDIPKRNTMLQLLPHARCVIEAHRMDPFEPCGTAHTPLVDTIATSVSTASRTPVDCSRWFLVSNGLLRVDLECSAWSSTMSSPIMMVAPTPTRRDHLALNVTACMHPAGSCKASITSVGRAKALHHALEKRALQCTVKQDCVFVECRWCWCKRQGQLQRQRGPPACTLLTPRKLLITVVIYVYHTTPYHCPTIVWCRAGFRMLKHPPPGTKQKKSPSGDGGWASKIIRRGIC